MRGNRAQLWEEERGRQRGGEETLPGRAAVSSGIFLGLVCQALAFPQ